MEDIQSILGVIKMITITWTDEFYGIIDDLDSRPELILVTDSYQVQLIKDHIGNPEWANDYHSFFVEVQDGEYINIFGLEYIIPYSSYPIYKITKKHIPE